MQHRLTSLLTCLVLIALSGQVFAQAPAYSITQLTFPASNEVQAIVNKLYVNSNGQAVGVYTYPRYKYSEVHGFYWSGSQLTLNADQYIPVRGIRTDGLITTNPYGNVLAGYFPGLSPLSPLPPDIFSAVTVNDAGYTAITTVNPQTFSQIFLYRNGSYRLVEQIALPSNYAVEGSAANNLGSIAGRRGNAAVVWFSDNSSVVLPVVGSPYSTKAIAINDSNQAVYQEFYQGSGTYYYRGYFWDPKTGSAQLPLNNVVGISNAKAIIGTRDSNAKRPGGFVIEPDGSAYNLANIAGPGYAYVNPTNIAPNGDIGGIATTSNGPNTALIFHLQPATPPLQSGNGTIDYVHTDGTVINGYVDGLYQVTMSGVGNYQEHEANNGLYVFRLNDADVTPPLLDTSLTLISGTSIARLLASGSTLPAPTNTSGPISFLARFTKLTNPVLSLGHPRGTSGVGGNVTVQLTRVGN